jgi:hypothetical protein
MPLLKLAQRVVLVGIAEERGAAPDALDHLGRQLAWHGIAAEPRSIVEASKQTSALIEHAELPVFMMH